RHLLRRAELVRLDLAQGDFGVADLLGELCLGQIERLAASAQPTPEGQRIGHLPPHRRVRSWSATRTDLSLFISVTISETELGDRSSSVTMGRAGIIRTELSPIAEVATFMLWDTRRRANGKAG